MLMKIQQSLCSSNKYFSDIKPSYHKLFNKKIRKSLKIIFRCKRSISLYSFIKKHGLEEAIVKELRKEIINLMFKPITKKYEKILISVQDVNFDKNKWVNDNPGGPATRNKSWFQEPGITDMVIVYHEADKAGPHLDIHFTKYNISLGINLKSKSINGKKISDALSYKNGKLTKKSKDMLIDILKHDIENGKTGLFYNWDHTPNEAKTEWKIGNSPEGYGSGKIREIILEDKANILNISEKGTAETCIPKLDPKYKLSLFKLSNDKGERIILNRMKIRDYDFNKKLSLKYLRYSNKDELEKFEKDIPKNLRFIKYDGASAYIIIDNKGTRLFSPRVSKKTGHYIEYTGKINIDTNIYSDKLIIGMGEILIKEGNKYLDSSKISGILNRETICTNNAEFRLYRIDKYKNEDTTNLEYPKQLDLINKVSILSSNIYPPEKITIKEAKSKKLEGVVGVKENGTIYNGYKLKFRNDNEYDWQILHVDLKTGPNSRKGNETISGVVWFKSLESGKLFKMGPGQLGDREFCNNIMNNSKDYIGRVYKVYSLRGHEGRSAKLGQEHPDKGII